MGRYQWWGVHDSPISLMAAYSRPLWQRRLGIGGVYLIDKLGPVTVNALSVPLNYQFSQGEDLRLSIGLAPGLFHIAYDQTKLNPADPNDPLLVGFNSPTLPIVDAGIWVKYKGLDAGLSSKYVNQPTGYYNSYLAHQRRRMFYAQASYMHKIGENYGIGGGFFYISDAMSEALILQLRARLFKRVVLGVGKQIVKLTSWGNFQLAYSNPDGLEIFGLFDLTRQDEHADLFGHSLEAGVRFRF